MKRKTKRGINVYLILLLLFALFTLASIYTDLLEIHELKAEGEHIRELIEEEEIKQITIESRKHYYESDSYIEKFAREKLGLVKSNDVIFIDRNN